MRYALSLILLCLLVSHNAVARSFTAVDINSQLTAAGGTNPRGYWEFLPTAYTEESDRSFPLVIYLHGLGSGGNGTTELSKVLGNGPPDILNSPAHPLYDLFEDEQVIVLAPQVTASTWWNHGHIRPFLDFATSYYRIDPRRIYLTGLSAGATGVHSMMNNDARADEIAAYVPCAIRGQVLAGQGDALASSTAYWALTAAGDQSALAFNSGDRLASALLDPSPATLLSSYPGNDVVRTASLSSANGWTWETGVPVNAGASLKVTIFTGNSHNSWDRTYENPNFWDWLFTQEKPSVTLSSPLANARFDSGETVNLSLHAVDRDANPIPDAMIEWSSNLDGLLGYGANLTLSNLQIGVHKITATVSDSTYQQRIHVSRTLTIIRSTPYTARFDIGHSDYPTNGWNNLTDRIDGAVANAVDTDGTATGVRLEVTAPFDGYQVNGVLADDLYPLTVQRDTMYLANGSSPAQLSFSGLNPSRTYDMTFFASRTASNNRTANYTVDSSTTSLNAANNQSITASLSNLQPSAAGELILSIECDVAATYGYLGAIILSANQTNYELWTDDHFSPIEQADPAIVGQLQDPDADGIPTFLEYAFALNPRVANSRDVMPSLLQTGPHHGLRFTRSPNRSELTYQVLASSDLLNWDLIAESRNGAATVDVGSQSHSISESGTETKEVDVYDVSTSSPRFYRLQVLTDN
ncbi:peptidase-like protein [Coraliomargarita akajimensis]|uniref:Peptidase-like protein n=1 Tax=Coraliomargarita akajimensis (strain DSM 45221 / IAM 15411 / JCM 23193 / KCTC 12865 / 04OKA010-24) TaxID=583355 RepID=D5ENX4_CORAD|nr:peptidase-like protein [Coraliomargarita akajimensis]ADE53633.1 peptidase-like protein [Coraliomargarita akajimensis DSM 45221]